MMEKQIANTNEFRCNKCGYKYTDPFMEYAACPQCDSGDTIGLEVTLAKRIHEVDFEAAKFCDTTSIGRLEAAGTTKRAIKPAVYQYVEDYKDANLGAEPPKEQVAEYQKELEGNFNMTQLNKTFEDLISFEDFDSAVRNKESGDLNG